MKNKQKVEYSWKLATNHEALKLESWNSRLLFEKHFKQVENLQVIRNAVRPITVILRNT